MQQGGERAPLNPIVAWSIIGVVVLAALAFGFKFLGGGGGQFDKTGSEALMEKVKAGEKLYQPPPGIVPGMSGPGGSAPGSGSNGPMTGPGSMPTGPMGTPTSR
jgi:hypothetical protein